MITYETKLNSNNDPIEVRVYSEHKRIGTINKVPGGWQYFPYGHGEGGEIMGNIRQVKKSLESE